MMRKVFILCITFLRCCRMSRRNLGEERANLPADLACKCTSRDVLASVVFQDAKGPRQSDGSTSTTTAASPGNVVGVIEVVNSHRSHGFTAKDVGVCRLLAMEISGLLRQRHEELLYLNGRTPGIVSTASIRQSFGIFISKVMITPQSTDLRRRVSSLANVRVQVQLLHGQVRVVHHFTPHYGIRRMMVARQTRERI